jgi:hypothetical protein
MPVLHLVIRRGRRLVRVAALGQLLLQEALGRQELHQHG